VFRFLRAVTLIAGAGYVAWRFLRGGSPGVPEQAPDKIRSAADQVADAVPDAVVPGSLKQQTSSRASGSTSGNGSSSSSDMTKAELYERAKELGIEGRSKMSKQDLERAIRDAS
jgi:hypothetical protein